MAAYLLFNWLLGLVLVSRCFLTFRAGLNIVQHDHTKSHLFAKRTFFFFLQPSLWIEVWSIPFLIKIKVNVEPPVEGFQSLLSDKALGYLLGSIPANSFQHQSIDVFRLHFRQHLMHERDLPRGTHWILTLGTWAKTTEIPRKRWNYCLSELSLEPLYAHLGFSVWTPFHN